MSRNQYGELLAALNYMNSLIDEDGEFPDAAFRAAQVFGVNQNALEEAYDEQFNEGFQNDNRF